MRQKTIKITHADVRVKGHYFTPTRQKEPVAATEMTMFNLSTLGQ